MSEAASTRRHCAHAAKRFDLGIVIVSVAHRIFASANFLARVFGSLLQALREIFFLCCICGKHRRLSMVTVNGSPGKSCLLLTGRGKYALFCMLCKFGVPVGLRELEFVVIGPVFGWGSLPLSCGLFRLPEQFLPGL